MNYSEALSYMTEKSKLGSRPGLGSVTELLNRLGNPQLCAPVLHIAGTNGKGSIMAYVERILIEAGFMVGRYISPTIFDYRERFQINGVYISEEETSDILTLVRDAEMKMAEEGLDSPTAFEIETAAAFLYFKRHNVDIMLIECGMGGRLDATNVFPDTMISILASVSLDHMNELGDTISKITKEKLGIVKTGGTLVTYPLVQEAEDVVNDYCCKHHVMRYAVKEEDIRIVRSDLNGTAFIYKGKKYEIQMPCDYQVKNAATALAVMEAFQKRAESYGLKPVSEDAVRRGLRETTWQGRFTVLSRNPYLIADGAHNRDAWKVLAGNLNKYFTKRKIIYIIGVLRDKEYSVMLDCLLPSMECAATVTPESPRAFDGEKLAELIRQREKPARYFENIPEAVCFAKEKAGTDGIIVACGSLTFIGEVIRANAKG